MVCSNFGHPALTSSFKVYALCKCHRHATKIIHHHSKAQTNWKLTVHLQLLQNYASPAKNLNYVNDEVRAGCLKLGHTTLALLYIRVSPNFQRLSRIDMNSKDGSLIFNKKKLKKVWCNFSFSELLHNLNIRFKFNRLLF